MSELKRYDCADDGGRGAERYERPEGDYVLWSPALQAAWELAEAADWCEKNGVKFYAGPQTTTISKTGTDYTGWCWQVEQIIGGEWGMGDTLPEAVAALKEKMGGSRG